MNGLPNDTRFNPNEKSDNRDMAGQTQSSEPLLLTSSENTRRQLKGAQRPPADTSYKPAAKIKKHLSSLPVAADEARGGSGCKQPRQSSSGSLVDSQGRGLSY